MKNAKRIWIAGAVLGGALLLTGILLGQQDILDMRGATVCLECIGIG